MERFSAGSAAESLQSLQSSGLLAHGCVNLISVEAIKNRAEDRWPKKRELVWEFTERKLHERLAVQDLIVRVSETDYLVAIPAEHPSAAQAVCMRVLEEVLLYFVGRLDRADIVIKRVDSIEGDEISCSPVDITRVAALEQDALKAAAGLRDQAADESEKNPAIFTSITGRDLRIDFDPRPITSLKHRMLAALYIDRTVVEVGSGRILVQRDQDTMADVDILRIDAATLDYAQIFLLETRDISQAVLVIPVSYRTLTSRRGREALIANGAGKPAFKLGAILELRDIHHGTPHSRVSEVVGIGKTIARGVFARVPPGPGDLACLKDTGLSGLTIDFRSLISQLRESPVALATLGARLGKLAGSLSVLGVTDSRLAPKLLQAGFTHLSLKATGVPPSE